MQQGWKSRTFKYLCYVRGSICVRNEEAEKKKKKWKLAQGKKMNKNFWHLLWQCHKPFILENHKLFFYFFSHKIFFFLYSQINDHSLKWNENGKLYRQIIFFFEWNGMKTKSSFIKFFKRSFYYFCVIENFFFSCECPR